MPINAHAWHTPIQYNPGFMCGKVNTRATATNFTSRVANQSNASGLYVSAIEVVNATLRLLRSGVDHRRSDMGGAIHVVNGVLLLQDTSLVHNVAACSGGALAALANSSVLVQGGVVRDNVAGVGGMDMSYYSRSSDDNFPIKVGRSQFMYHCEAQDWASAKATCAHSGGKLAKVTNAEQKHAIRAAASCPTHFDHYRWPVMIGATTPNTSEYEGELSGCCGLHDRIARMFALLLACCLVFIILLADFAMG